MTDPKLLGVAVRAFACLLVGLSLHYLLLRRMQLPWSVWPRLQARLRIPALIPVFLGAVLVLCQGLESLQFLAWTCQLFLLYGFFITLLEALLSPFADGPEGLQIWLRVVLYGGSALVPLALANGVPIFDPELQSRMASVGVLYLSLHLSYTYLIKWLPWQHPLTLALRQRLRFLLYLLLLALVGYFALVHFEVFPSDSPELAYGRAALLAIMATILFEGAMVALFDYYFPLIRRLDVPTLFRDLARGLGYLTIVAVVAVTVLGKDPSSLLLGSAVVSVALGFALQETLGNFFAGLALRLARPYTLGDFIEVSHLSGNVQKIDWRSTSMLNNQGDLLILPNAKLAQEIITNHNSPTSVTGRFIEVGVHYRHPPNLVKRTLEEACLSVAESLREPKPEVYVMAFSDSAITYRLRYFVPDFGSRFRIDSKVREAIWYHFHREQIEIPFPIRTLYHAAPEAGVDVEREVRSLLDSVDFFQILGEDGLAALRRKARYELYAAGERICVQGQPGESLYIIRRGRLKVTILDSKQELVRSDEMRAGQYFGEMALLTGEPRSATVTALTDSEVLRLRKEDLRAILSQNPKVEERLSEVLAERKLKTDQALQEAEEGRHLRGQVSANREGLRQLSQQILFKIRDFFSY